MEASNYDSLVQRAARAICAATNIAAPGEREVIYDAPDDLTWDKSTVPPQPAPRWRLYEERGRAAVNAVGVSQIADALRAILKQVERGRNAVAPLIVERAFQDIESLARRALDQVESP